MELEWESEAAEVSLLLTGMSKPGANRLARLLRGCNQPALSFGFAADPSRAGSEASRFELVFGHELSVDEAVGLARSADAPCLVIAEPTPVDQKARTREVLRRAGALEVLFADEITSALLEHAIRSALLCWRLVRSMPDGARDDAGSSIDVLTGLPDVQAFMFRVAAAVERKRHSPGTEFTVLLIDIVQFSYLSGSLGREVGEEVLTSVAARIAPCLEQSDLLARVSAHNFAVLIEGEPDDERAFELSARIHAQMEKPLRLVGDPVYATVRIGLTAGAREYSAPEDVMRDARAAMLRARTEGRDQVFKTSFHSEAVDQFRRESALRAAIDQSQFLLHYQPIVSLVTKRLVGFEALVRWNRGSAGLVPPLQFIPLAEETGLIVPIGNWVMAEATKQLRSWDTEFELEGGALICVNVSAQQVAEPGFTAEVEKSLRDAGLHPSCLKIEFTETTLMDGPERVVRVIHELREIGVHVWIDDFGTGYSSLSYLQRFPVDGLKIDKSFVDPLDGSDGSAAMARTIIGLADGLGLSTVAEGIEHEVQAEQLLGMGCVNAQGYLFSRPLSVADAYGYLARCEGGVPS